MILRRVEMPSCNCKNVRVRAHGGLFCQWWRRHPRENVSNHPYTVSDKEDVPTKHQNTVKLYGCGAIALKTTQNIQKSS